MNVNQLQLSPPLSLRMPAEWEKQEAVWLAWPHNKEDWPDKFGPIPWVYGEIVRHLAQAARVRLIVKNPQQQDEASSILERAGTNMRKVDFHIIPTDRVWTRDCGPTFVYGQRLESPLPPGEGQGEGKRAQASRRASPHPNLLPKGEGIPGTGQRILLDWHFNAWAKYPNWKKDDKLPAQIADILKLPRIQPTHKAKRIVLEGGSIDVNGKGTLLTTEECLLSKVQCRNPGLKREDYEEIFAQYLGIRNVIWLADGIAGDDTHGHVDDLARFVNASTVVIASEKDKRDANFTLLRENLKRLKKARDQNGKPLTVIELPMPRPVIFEGQRLPASYANFLITNNLVLVPTFNDPNDRIALNILAQAMPKHDIVGIYCGDFVWGLGTIHCASQQEPI